MRRDHEDNRAEPTLRALFRGLRARDEVRTPGFEGLWARASVAHDTSGEARGRPRTRWALAGVGLTAILGLAAIAGPWLHPTETQDASPVAFELAQPDTLGFLSESPLAYASWVPTFDAAGLRRPRLEGFRR